MEFDAVGQRNARMDWFTSGRVLAQGAHPFRALPHKGGVQAGRSGRRIATDEGGTPPPLCGEGLLQQVQVGSVQLCSARQVRFSFLSWLHMPVASLRSPKPLKRAR
jgi:hypothetical protein